MEPKPARTEPGADAPPRDEAAEASAFLRLGKPHGLHGAVRADSPCPAVLDLAEFCRDREFLVRREGVPAGTVVVRELRPFKGGWLAFLEGACDRDLAETWRGAELCLPRSQRPELPDGWFWEEDLIGLTVRDPRYGELGRAAGLNDSGAQTCLIVERPDGNLLEIPWADALVPDVDLDAREIRTALPADWPGLE